MSHPPIDPTLPVHALRLLVCGAPLLEPAFAQVDRCDDLDAVPAHLAGATAPDAVLAGASRDAASRMLGAPAWETVLRDVAVLVLMPAPLDESLALGLIGAGVQDVLGDDETAAPALLERRLRRAVARKRVERAARTLWSTDLNTGLPNRAQLIEHLSQLLALRARQPAPMALLVLRIDGLAPIGAAHGAEAAQVVRRKVAVRLRASVRSSDVVASLGGDAFALLLAKIEAPADAQRVALKLARALREPFSVLGAAVGVSAHVGVALHPGDGDDAEALLRHAIGAAQRAERRRIGAANE